MMEPLPPVTAHAMLRYLQRIEGVNLKAVADRAGRHAGNWVVLRAALEQLGLSMPDLARRILPPELEPSLRAGAARIRRPGYVLICEGGRVVSILEKEIRKTRTRSEREMRKMVQRGHRRGWL